MEIKRITRYFAVSLAVAAAAIGVLHGQSGSLAVTAAAEELIPAITADYGTEIDGAVIASGECGLQGNNVTYQLTDKGTLYISGSGDMANYLDSQGTLLAIPWKAYQNDIKSIVIGDGVTTIGHCAFRELCNAASVSISDTVTYIGSEAFYACSSLTSIDIPASVSGMNASPFAGCTALESINVSEDSKYFCSVDGVIFNYAKTALYTYPAAKAGKAYIIPEGVTACNFGAFTGCLYLEELTLPDSMTYINTWAFENCTNLKKVTLPETLTAILQWAFKGCENLESINIPESVEHIHDGAFLHCISLKSITIPENVLRIGHNAFYGCESLAEIDIPASVEEIGDDAFYGCNSLTAIRIAEENPSYCSVDGVMFNKSMDTLVKYPQAKSTKSYTVPDGVKQITDYAFYANGFLEEIILSDSVETIGAEAFTASRMLKNAVLGSGIKTIKTQAFSSCGMLESINFPDGLETVEGYAFTFCPSLKTFILPDSVTTLGFFQFYEHKNLEEVKLPPCVTKIDFDSFYGCTVLKRVVLSEGVEEICENAFSMCTQLAEINLPNSIEQIGEGAFHGCNSLTSITVPEKVTSIKSHTFYSCTSLSDISLPDGITEISDYAFAYSALESIALPHKTVSIGNYAFQGCENLTELILPSGLKSIGKCSFWMCTKLEELSIPDSVDSIGYSAFRECSSLKNIILPDSVTVIADNLFFLCTELRTVTIPAGITNTFVPADLFYNCTNLTDIYYKNTRDSWNNLTSNNTKYDRILHCLDSENPSVKASAAGGKVLISWNKTEGATSYRVYRVDAETNVKSLLKTVGILNCTDTTAVEGKTYYYLVDAYNSKTNILTPYPHGVVVDVTASIAAPTLPEKPFFCLNDIITVKWNEVEGATSYRVYRATSPTGAKTQLKTTGLLRYTDQPKSGTYYYFIAAYNSKTGLLSDYSAPIKVSLITKPVISKAEYSNGTVALEWNYVNTATSYRVFRTDKDTGVKTQIKTVGINRCTDTNVEEGKTYIYTVQAWNNNLRIISASANPKTVTISDLAAPEITSASYAGGSVSLAWTSVDGATSYRVYRADSATGEKTLLKSTGILRFTDTTAKAGKTYYYFVAAYNSKTGTMSSYSAAEILNT